MEAVGMILLIIGMIVTFVGGVWFLVVAFQESILWGLGCLFIPIVPLFFLILHWDQASKPFLVQLAGFVPLMVGALMAVPDRPF